MKKLISITIAVLLVLSTCFALVACDNYIADNTEHFDDITKTLKLNKEYANKLLYTHGIGEARVDRFIDGDTTRFALKNSGATLTVRYYQINTPESTGLVEEWGKAASLFTQEALTDAEILLESTNEGKAPSSESNGRVLAYVWYRKSADEDFKCLNLELVENGFSPNNGVEDPEYPYYSYFAKAQEYAKKIKLRLWSDLADPNFVVNVTPITLKQFREEVDYIEAHYKDPDYDPEQHTLYNPYTGYGALIQFEAFLENLTISTSGTFTFTATQFDEATGKKYSVNVYAAYSSNKASEMYVGDYYKIVGNIQKYVYNNGDYVYQITSIQYDETNETDKTTNLKQSNYFLSFNSTIPANGIFRQNYAKNVYCDLTVTEASVTADGVVTFKGSASRITGVNKWNTSDVRVFTFKYKLGVGESLSLNVGDVIRVCGIKYDKTSDVVTMLSLKPEDFAVVKRAS